MNLKWPFCLVVMLLPASLFANTLYFPQVAFGGGYSTSFVIINNGATDVSSQVNFYSQNGASRPDLTAPVNIPAGSTARFTIPDAGPLTAVWGELAAGEGTLRGIAAFEVRVNGALTTTAGVLALEAGGGFIMPVDVTPSASTGIAIANVNATTALNVRLRLIGEGGIQVATTTIPVPAHGQIARFVNDIFTLGSAGFRGTLNVDTPSGSPANALAATALTVKEGILSALPVLPGSGGGGGTLYFPQVAFGGGFSTTFVLINMGDANIQSIVNFYDQNGHFRAEYSEPVNLLPGGSKRFTRPDTGPLQVLWGELAVGSGAVQGVASFDLRSGNGALQTTAGVLGLQAGPRSFCRWMYPPAVRPASLSRIFPTPIAPMFASA